MADPLSILGAALGVVSLGLQVREEITSYCKAWRGAEEEIQEIANKAESLEGPLKALREIIQESQLSNPGIAYDLQNKIQSIRGGIQKVQNAVDLWKPALSAKGFGEKMRAQRKRAAYPFRKEALRALANDLDSLQMGLQTTLHVFSAQNTRLIPSLVLAQGKLLREVQSMHLELQHISKLSSPPPPELLQTWCDEQKHAINTKRELEHELGETVAVFDSRTRGKGSYSYYSRLLNITISASFFMTRGAGGFSIAPSLTLRVPLSPNHPGFFSIYIHGLSAKSQRPEEFVNNIIDLLKHLFTTGQASPSDLGSDGNSFLDAACFAFLCSSQWHPDAYVHFARLFAFLINSGAPLSTSTSLGGTGLDKFIGAVKLNAEKSRMLTRLAHRGGIVTVRGALQSPISKANLRQVLVENEEVVDIPDIAKAIIQESEHDLSVELLSGRASPNDIIGNTALIQLAVGWPRGIEILADAGVNLHRSYPLSPLHMAMRERNYQSSKALLEAGHPLKPDDICAAESLNDGNKVTKVLIAELSKRRKRLAIIAQANMSQIDVAGIGLIDSDFLPSSIPDIVASKIFLALKKRGVNIDPSLEVAEPSMSVYHQPFRKIDTLDLLFEHGFTDIDARDSSGKTPLMTMISSSGIFESSNKRRRWLISKGADPTRSLPWGNNSGGTVLHLLGTCLASMLAREITHTATSELREFQSPESDSEEDPLFDLRYALRAPCRDNCLCACSMGGCTPLLAALRHLLLRYTPRFYMKDGVNRLPGAMNFLISRAERSVDIQISVIRLITFDALDLTHTCCRKSDTFADDRLQYMEKAEVDEIRDEESLLLEEFESLLDDLVAEFQRLGLPIIEFLQGPWYRMVLGHINRLGTYDEIHMSEVRGIGLKLQATDDVSGKVSLMLGSKVLEIED
ncbi:hypothetical protein N7481_002465 [Penicillium waksmanii]|uniref:uncharacterized protein n=1 Tax=Penicillium waksmanii TaxID=69791 RepID=UPI002548A839|nr:uncharacterized protein N7481_002465 [Penicillium waksmanii]KAJ5995488.1 hypothetical protein N7481_002465 [Penicillium waksmanii]